jgi:hypothetical protein
VNEQEFQLREQQLREMFDIEREKYLTELAQLRSQLDAWNLYRQLRAKVDEIERIVDQAHPQASGWYLREQVKRVIREIKEREI